MELRLPPWLIGAIIALLAMAFPFVYNRFFASKKHVASVFSNGPLKQVFLVRMDLKMGPGKIAAQCSHAAVKAYRDMSEQDSTRKLTELWEYTGQAKVVLRVPDEATLIRLSDAAKRKGINVASIKDAGRTQIPAGSMTVSALGPADAETIDSVTGDLKLL